MTNNDSPIQLFVGLSAVLTGIDAGKLNPDLDPVNIKQAYFEIAKQSGGATFDQLLAIFSANRGKPSADIGDIILNKSGDRIRYLARSIMLAWYLGSWYRPEDLQKPPTGGPPFTLISAAAYTQGWVWRVAQAHPMGYSDLTFGYWANNPPPLSDFIKGSNP
jgi:hypothetical protein